MKLHVLKDRSFRDTNYKCAVTISHRNINYELFIIIFVVSEFFRRLSMDQYFYIVCRKHVLCRFYYKIWFTDNIFFLLWLQNPFSVLELLLLGEIISLNYMSYKFDFHSDFHINYILKSLKRQNKEIIYKNCDNKGEMNWFQYSRRHK